MQIKKFTFNPFQENTYVLYDQTSECIVIDPGMYNRSDRVMFDAFIKENNLKIVKLINTHCHVDHVFGNGYITDTYGLKLQSHRGEIPVLEAYEAVCQKYGLEHHPSPKIEEFLEDGDIVTFGRTELQVLYTPGHSPASISFFNKETKTLIAGDVLFEDSIGRTDLPGGDFNTLINSIKTKFYPLPDETKVFPGHGNSTTIGKEKKFNPFLNQI